MNGLIKNVQTVINAQIGAMNDVKNIVDNYNMGFINPSEYLAQLDDVLKFYKKESSVEDKKEVDSIVNYKYLEGTYYNKD